MRTSMSIVGLCGALGAFAPFGPVVLAQPLEGSVVAPPSAPSAPDSPATPADAAPPPDASVQARLDFRTGMAAYDERRFHDAIAAFQRAAVRVPSADLWFNIARAYEELGEIDGAVEYYGRYLRDRVDPPDRERVEAHIADLEERAEAERVRARQNPTTGTLRIDVDLPGASVSVDEQPIGTSPIALPLTYAAGTHIIDVRLEGRIPFRARVRIEAGSSVVAIANLAEATEYRSVRGRRRVTWVMAALAAASLGASVGLGAHAASLNRDGDRADARRWARYSDYALGGTALFGIGTVTLYFAEGRAVRTERVE